MDEIGARVIKYSDRCPGRFTMVNRLCIGMVAVIVLSLAAALAVRVYKLSSRASGGRLAVSVAERMPVVCRKAVWDCGTVSQNSPMRLDHIFTLENLSNKIVKVDRVSADCGCIVADKYPKEIGPGSLANYEVGINLPPDPGTFHKYVSVVFDTSPTSKLGLSIRGTIAPSSAFYSAPKALDFGIIDEDESATRKLKIARYNNSPVKFIKATTGSEAIRVEEISQAGDEGLMLELTLTLDGSRVRGQEDIRSRVVVTTDHEGFRVLEIPFVARVKAKPHGLVSSLFIDRLPKGASCEKSIVEATEGGTQVEELRYEGDSPLTVELVQAGDENKSVSVRISREDGEGKPMVCQGVLIAKVTGRKTPVLIPFGAYLPD